MSREGGITISILTDTEKSEAAGEVRTLITSSGETATILRAEPSEKLYGSDDETYAKVVTFPLEMTEMPPADISKAIDARACVLPDLDVRVGDRVRFGDSLYRVQTVIPEVLFGVETHKTLDLVRVYEG